MSRALRATGAAFGAALAFGAAGCGTADQPATGPTQTATASVAAAAFPDTLAPGDPYPDSAGACRRLGESAATSNWLDDSAILVGCPDATSASALGGKVVGEVEGVTVVSVPMGDANATMASDESPDVKVPGTDYEATTILSCSLDGGKTTQQCNAGVKRNWGEAGQALVEVTKPDGRKRAIYFKGTTPYGADSAQADGSAAYDFSVRRTGDQVTISFGPERYTVVDALIEGG